MIYRLQISVQAGSRMIDGLKAFLPFPSLPIWMSQVKE